MGVRSAKQPSSIRIHGVIMQVNCRAYIYISQGLSETKAITYNLCERGSPRRASRRQIGMDRTLPDTSRPRNPGVMTSHPNSRLSIRACRDPWPRRESHPSRRIESGPSALNPPSRSSAVSQGSSPFLIELASPIASLHHWPYFALEQVSRRNCRGFVTWMTCGPVEEHLGASPFPLSCGCLQ